MKKIAYVLLVTVASFWALSLHSQESPRRILGNFIYKNKLYNFEFTKEAESNYSFLVSNSNGKKVTSQELATTNNIQLNRPFSNSSIDSANISNSPDSSSDTTIALRPPVSSADTTVNTAEQNEIGGEDLPMQYFAEFSQDIFRKVFTDQMIAKYGAIDTTELKDKAVEIFFKIKTRLDFFDDEPVTAFIILRKDTLVSLLRSNVSKHYVGKLSRPLASHFIQRVTIETEGGAIKNIFVKAILPDLAKDMNQSPRQFLEFKNAYPINISGKYDPEKFANQNLYCFNCNGVRGLTRYIKLSDLLILDLVLENDKEDYSPSNKVVSLTSANSIVELRKERRSRILEVAAFTDFVGLDREEPNGLIQIEVRRRININTKSKLLSGYARNEGIVAEVNISDSKFGLLSKDSLIKKYEDVKGKKWQYFKVTNINKDTSRDSQQNNNTLNEGNSSSTKKSINNLLSRASDSSQIIAIKNTNFHSTYQTWFNYIEPRFLFSKMEDNNRLIDSVKAGSGIVNQLTLYQYQLVSFGVGMQIYKLNFPQLKFQWDVLSVGAYWGRSRIAKSTDSVGPSSPLNSMYGEFQTRVLFRPDNRWGASVGFQFMLPKIWNPEFQLPNSRGLFQYQFDAHMKTSGDSKLFFRYRCVSTPLFRQI